MAQAKLLSMTAFLSVLIWASADNLVNEAVTISVAFEVAPATADSSMVVALANSGISFELEISGARRAVEVIQAIAPLRVRLLVPEYPTGPGQYVLDRENLKRTIVEQLKEFQKVTILSVNPDFVGLTVDHWFQADVTLTTGTTSLEYDVEPQLQRSSISVRMLESRFKIMAPQGQLPPVDISADVERLLSDQPPGQNVTLPITLDSTPFGPEARLMPPNVLVTAALKAQRTTAEISTVPILLAVSFPNLQKPYKALPRDGGTLVTETITVSGPTEAVARLQRGETRAFGIIHLKDDDLQDLNTWKILTPEFRLPPGIELAADPKPVEFKLIEANDTEKPNEASSTP